VLGGGRIQIGSELAEQVPAFALKRCASDEMEYATEVAEDKDLVYLIQNTCIYCNRLMGKNEVKILPPSYIQERDQYVNGGVVKRRLMCLQCYNNVRSASRQRVKFDRYRHNRAQLLRGTISRLLASR
jgi:hypothetical protein